VSYVDISSHQSDAGFIDLKAYWNAGHRDLMLKATEGTTYSWSQMRGLAQQWHGFGLNARVGYYHWLYGNESADAQFAWFWSQVSGVFRQGDWLMTDFEDTDAGRQVSDAAFAAALRRFNELAAGEGPIHTYTGNWYIANKPQCIAYLRTQPVVMSDYAHSPPLNPYGLSYVAHQYTDRASVPGMPGLVDYNRWLGESPSGGGIPLEDSMSAADVAALEAWISAKFEGTINRVVEIRSTVDALPAATATAVVNRSLGGVGYDGSVADILAGIHAAIPGIAQNSYGAYKAVQLVLDALAKVQPPSPTPANIDYAALAAAFRSELAKTPLTITGSAA
jgi:GH25 family lysozyme M1 (1,4-beta-N-acetylmuramidase)